MEVLKMEVFNEEYTQEQAEARLNFLVFFAQGEKRLSPAKGSGDIG
jgi:hypothetical protein